MSNFQIVETPEFKRDFEEIKVLALQALEGRKRSGKKPGRQEDLYKKLLKTIKYLKTNPKHPSLNTHKYDGLENPYNPNSPVFEAYVENKRSGAYRLFWCYGPDNRNMTLIRVTAHP